MPFLSRNLVGVDIGARTIKVVSFRGSGGHYRLETAQAVPTGGEGRAEALARVAKAGRLAGRKAATVLTESMVTARPLELPRMPEGELAEAVRWELGRDSAVPRDELVTDYIYRGGAAQGGDEVSLVGFSAKKSDTLALIEDFSRAGLELSVIDTVPTALHSAFSLSVEWEKGFNYAVLDIGETETTLIVFKDGAVEFIRQIHFGGSDITKSVAAALHVSDDEAEEFKKSRGLAGYGAPAEAAGDEEAGLKAVSSVVEGLCSEVRRTIEYFQAQFRAGPVSTLYLAGGTAKASGIDDFISETMGLLCFVLDPLRKTTVPEKGFDRAHLGSVAPSLAVAAGLATRKG